LRRSAAQSVTGAASVEVLNLAIAECMRIVQFNIAKRGRSSNFVSGFGFSETGGSRTSFPVAAVTLDWLVEHFPRPTVIKIDVEAMEHLVLRGAEKVLHSHPILISEVSRENFAEVSRLLTGYKLLDTELHPLSGSESFNIVAMPF
jgi:FkbM family methyltransferase